MGNNLILNVQYVETTTRDNEQRVDGLVDYCTFITTSSIPFSPSLSNTSRQSIGGYRYIPLASNLMKMTDLFTCSSCQSRGRPACHSVLHLSIVSDCTLLKHDGTDRLDASDVLVANDHGFNCPVTDIGRDIKSVPYSDLI